VIANLANVSRVLKEAFGFFWVGSTSQKGISSCSVLFKVRWPARESISDSGVCGHAYSKAETIIVPNVDEFPDIIACSSASKSEIVVPIMNDDGGVFGVLDVDSDRLDDFSETDRKGLTNVVNVIERVIRSHTNSDKLE
jgi:GAF domain-containing protein